MNVWMLRNPETNDYYCSYKKNRNKRWTDQKRGSIWNRKSDIIQSIKANHLHEVEIVEYEMVELTKENKE